MESFVNRDRELSLINEAVTTLLDRERLLRTPIVEFYGVEGIGKTTLLTKVRDHCSNQELPFVWADIKKKPSNQFADPAKDLLAKDKPVVVIIDSLDAADKSLLSEIEVNLSELIQSNNVFIVLASRNIQRFDSTRSIARKLTLHPLHPLQRESCISYLNSFANTLTSTARDTIFNWTRGYPLAMQVMTDAIVNERLDPTKEQDSRQLLSILMQKVIEKKLLANVTSTSERERLQTLLALLSIPRRFNLILMQDLIEEFASNYKLESSLAYITLPREINEKTSILSWSMERAAYCIDTTVRNLFLLHYRVERLQQYVEIHKLLANKNENFAREVTGSDKIRYLREFFYHLACSKQETRLRECLIQQIEQMAPVQTQDERKLLQSLQSFLQFYEEFGQDEELQEALGQDNARFALSLVYKNFIEIYRHLPKEMQENWLKRFFSLITPHQEEKDFAFIFEEGIRQIIKQVLREEAIKLYNDLIQGTALKVLLGNDFEAVRSRVADLLAEG